MSIVLDSEKYLFIADYVQRRIIGSGPNGFRCLLHCNRESQPLSHSSGPAKLSFDVSGNLFVLGSEDRRIEKFYLEKDSCVDKSSYCYIGGPCNTQVKGIGLTLDDILRHRINRNMTIKDQPFVIKISAALTMIMLVVGVLSSICSILTFQNEILRKVGCGVYLLASSITSLLTIIMFTIKFCIVPAPFEKRNHDPEFIIGSD
ncbi:hypothetical protein I4U23_016540 [Adineta vaga]|nr:hypothetical protein I4U23_016540 [Adineta vaga]